MEKISKPKYYIICCFCGKKNDIYELNSHIKKCLIEFESKINDSFGIPKKFQQIIQQINSGNLNLMANENIINSFNKYAKEKYEELQLEFKALISFNNSSEEKIDFQEIKLREFTSEIHKVYHKYSQFLKKIDSKKIKKFSLIIKMKIF